MSDARDDLLMAVFRRLSTDKFTFLFEYMFGPGECFLNNLNIKYDLVSFACSRLDQEELLELIDHMLREELMPDGTL
eukprot:4133966-Prymnesium_polylepis.1